MEKENSVYDEASVRILGKKSFKNALEDLLKKQRFLHSQNENGLPLETIKLLLESASVFAFSSKEKLKHLAYKIATIIADMYGYSFPELNYPIQYIIISTGLIPGLII